MTGEAWICCFAIIPMSNMALSCHYGTEFRKNPAGVNSSYPSLYLRGGKRSREGKGAIKWPKLSQLHTLPTLLIQNITLIGRAPDSTFLALVIHFVFLGMQQREDPRVKWLICLRMESKLNCLLNILFSPKHSRSARWGAGRVSTGCSAPHLPCQVTRSQITVHEISKQAALQVWE